MSDGCGECALGDGTAGSGNQMNQMNWRRLGAVLEQLLAEEGWRGAGCTQEISQTLHSAFDAFAGRVFADAERGANFT